VGNGFPRVRAVVDDQTVTGAFEAELLRDSLGLEQEVSQNFFVFWLGFGDAADRLFGNDKHVRRSARLDVFESADQVVLVHDGGGDLSIDDLLEERLAHGAVIRLGGSMHNQLTAIRGAAGEAFAKKLHDLVV